MLRELYRLLCVWHTQDRIRSAPGIGKLLRLQPGAQLFIGQALYRIVQRTQTSDMTSLAVAYELTAVDQRTPAQLSLAIDLARPTNGLIKFAQHSSTMEICHQDVTVLRRASPAR